MKYLGHVISADMKDDLDIMRQCRQLYSNYFSLLLFFVVHIATVVEIQG